MTVHTPITADIHTARHARLFELIRQSNLAQMQAQKAARAEMAADVQNFAQQAQKSLSPQEKQAIGISESFGR